MDWMFVNCSSTAQRGALDWRPRFKKAVIPVFKKLYKKVKNGNETRRVISECGRSDYQERLNKELEVMKNTEMWKTGATVRELRPREEHKNPVDVKIGTKGRDKA